MIRYCTLLLLLTLSLSEPAEEVSISEPEEAPTDSDILDLLRETLVTEEEDEVEDDKGDLGDLHYLWEDDGDLSEQDLPARLDLRELGVVSDPIFQGGGCVSCGWISGTQALEARVALVAEHHVSYSIQSFMNCGGKVCGGTQPYRVATITRNNPYIVPKDEMEYTKKECMKWGPGSTKCFCGRTHGNYTNVLDDQFVIIGPIVPTRTLKQLQVALQSGPVTTCFARKALKLGVKCKPGCSHANSIIGYNNTALHMQESIGRKWGPFKDGTWVNPSEDLCGKALLQKAYFTPVFYDYDRANAFFTEEIVEDSLEFVDVSQGVYGTSVTDLKNIGLAKNRCAFLGIKCKGVYQNPEDGSIQLIESIGKGKKKKKKKDKKNLSNASSSVKIYKKTQLVIYLKNDNSGKFINIKFKKGSGKLRMISNENKAAAFFSSYGRLISYNYPDHHMVENYLEKIEGDVKTSKLVDDTKTWTLGNCNIQNRAGNVSLGVGEMNITKAKGRSAVSNGLVATPTDLQDEDQRFDVGISGAWPLVSSKLGLSLLKEQKTGNRIFDQPGGNKKEVAFRWNARQLIIGAGKPFSSDLETAPGLFEFSPDPSNAVIPTNCKIMKKSSNTAGRLVVKGKNLKMAYGFAEETGDRWTFVYGKI